MASTSIEDNSENTTIGTGRGGNVTVIAPESVELKNGVLNTETYGTGDAGEITIRAGRLLIQDGGNVSTATYAQGKGGDLLINAPESVELIGIGKDFEGKNLANLSAKAQDSSTGPAGNLMIATGKLIVRDGAQVAVSSQGTGAAGNLKITSPSIFLDNGSLDATTTAGQGNVNYYFWVLSITFHISQATTNHSYSPALRSGVTST
ncbi:MAG: hypothetical protein JO235_27245 [Chroococcidiopsidaceae cyanobacterium CP_BM_RX_35]|nr:hypothetical protein [Chroococcidiopsidaceae cyanobacterium CP_BM_RX_35]